LLIDGTRIDDVDLQPNEFFDHKNSEIFSAMKQLSERGAGVDLNTVSAELSGVSFLELSEYLNISDVHTCNVVTYAADVRDCAIRREAFHIAQNLAIVASNGGDLAAVLTDGAIEKVKKLGHKVNTGGVKGIVSADDILSTEYPEPNWVIPGLLPSGVTILAGPPKVGKSWLALQIVQAVGAGGKALNQDVTHGNALYIALEDTERRLFERMKLQHWQRGLPVDFITGGNFLEKVGDLRNGGSERLANSIDQMGYKIVVVDTFSRAIRGRQKEAEEMTTWLEPVFNVAHDLDVSIVFIDHHRKSNGIESDVVADIMGSTAKGGMADTLWGLYRKRGQAEATLAITGRDVEERQIVVSWAAVTGCWQSQGDAGAIALTERRQEILDVLRVLGTATVIEIAREIGQPKGHTQSRLQDLAAQGLIKRLPIGEHIYYELIM